jgi:hypothetical protein
MVTRLRAGRLGFDFRQEEGTDSFYYSLPRPISSEAHPDSYSMCIGGFSESKAVRLRMCGFILLFPQYLQWRGA